VFQAIRPVADDDPRQPFVALETDQKILEGNDIKDQTTWSMSFDFLPTIAADCIDRGAHDFEIFGAIGIRQNDQIIVVMLNRVFVPSLARADEAGGEVGLIGLDQMHLASLMVMSTNHDKTFALRHADTDEKSRVFLAIDQDVVFSVGPERMPVDLPWAVIVIQARIEQRLSISRPNEAAARVRYLAAGR